MADGIEISLAAKFMEDVDHERAAQIWKDYPILDYDKGWDVLFGVPPLGGMIY